MLKQIRLNRKFSQSLLAKKIGISQSYLSKLENTSSRVPNINTDLIEKLSIELDVCPIILFLYFYSPYEKCYKNCCQYCGQNFF